MPITLAKITAFFCKHPMAFEFSWIQVAVQPNTRKVEHASQY